MATKKSSKKASKKAAMPSKIEIRLTRSHHAAAQRCLERSGKIVLGIKELSVTKLPKVIQGSNVIID